MFYEKSVLYKYVDVLPVFYEKSMLYKYVDVLPVFYERDVGLCHIFPRSFSPHIHSLSQCYKLQ